MPIVPRSAARRGSRVGAHAEAGRRAAGPGHGARDRRPPQAPRGDPRVVFFDELSIAEQRSRRPPRAQRGRGERGDQLMDRFLPDAPLSRLIGAGASAVAAELASERQRAHDRRVHPLSDPRRPGHRVRGRLPRCERVARRVAALPALRRCALPRERWPPRSTSTPRGRSRCRVQPRNLPGHRLAGRVLVIGAHAPVLGTTGARL